MKRKANNKHDIFISYRRDGGFETASLIAERLKNAGYRVFLDLDSLTSGRFDEQLYEVIEDCIDFILVLPPNGLDRCENEDDWIRLETLHAFKFKKNIVPVMLPGFDFSKEIPECMKDLKNYNAIKINSYEYFNAAIEKLRMYLRSKPGITWRRYRKPILAVGAVVFIGLCIGGYWAYRENILFKRVAVSETLLMGTEFSKIHTALESAVNAKKAWEKYLVNFSSSRDTADLRKMVVSEINHIMMDLPEARYYQVSPENLSIFTRHGIKAEEFIVFYSDLCPSFYTEVKDYLNKLIAYSDLPFISESITQNAGLSFQTLVLSARINYYGFLSLLATLPKAVYNDDFYKMRNRLIMFSDIPLNKTHKEYDEDQEAALNELQNLITEMGYYVKNDASLVESMQYALTEVKEKVSNAILDDKKIDLDLKKQKLDEGRIELAKKQNELDEVYRRLLQKCSFSADEGQGIMWGKILLLATAARNKIKIWEEYKKREKLNGREAISKNEDLSSIDEANMLSIDEIFREIDKRIDLYMEYNRKKDPNVEIYGAAAKHYFKHIRKGDIEDMGVLVFGIENNANHPVIKMGDIIVERKGKPIRYIDDYFNLKDDPVSNTVKIVNFEASGNVITRTETIPETTIRVGLLDLREMK